MYSYINILMGEDKKRLIYILKKAYIYIYIYIYIYMLFNKMFLHWALRLTNPNGV